MTGIARTGQEIWEAFRADAGLQTHTPYDKAVVGEVARSLGLKAGDDLGAAIGEAGLEATPVLIALLGALAPWAQMLRDLLALMQAAGAKTTKTQLRADVDLKRAGAALKLDLEHFSEAIDALEQFQKLVSTRMWSAADLGALWGVLPGSHEVDQALPDAVQVWLDAYGPGDAPTYPPDVGWPAPPGAPERTGDPALDRAVTAAYVAWSSVLALLAMLAPTRLALVEWREKHADMGESDTWQIAHHDHDNWAAAILSGLHRLVAHVRAGHTSWTYFGRSRTPQDLISLVDTIPIRQDVLAERYALARILSLPVWQKRYDLYSNWIFTRIVDALAWTRPQVLVTGEHLRFGFAATEMARSAEPSDLAVYAELGSPLKGESKKRTEGVQPDYSVLLGDDDDPAGSSIVEVECKQYRQARADNFGPALHDYALARPEAVVLLVNYGPISPGMQQSILKHVAPEVHGRCHMIANVRPGETEALAAFHDLLEQSVRHRLPAAVDTQPADTATDASAIATLGVRWHGPADLDLHLRIDVDGQTETISYECPGALGAPPFAHLRRDVTSGPGPEEILISRWLHGTYRVSVHAFRGDLDIAVPVVTLGDGRFELPDGSGTWWDVAEIDGATGAVTELARRR